MVMKKKMTTYNRLHGSPYDRGDSDAYYGRKPNPHAWLDGLGREVLPKEMLTDSQVAEYYLGYDENPSGSKDWGYE